MDTIDCTEHCMDRKERGMNRTEALQEMLEMLDRTGGVLTAGEIHPDVPTIHDVGNRDGQRLKSTVPVEHKGFGLFMGMTPNGEKFSFDGGGAMYRSEEPYPEGISFTALRCSFEAAKSMGYNREKARTAIEGLLVGGK